MTDATRQPDELDDETAAESTEPDPSNTDIELLTAPIDDDDEVLTLVDRQDPSEQ